MHSRLCAPGPAREFPQAVAGTPAGRERQRVRRVPASRHIKVQLHAFYTISTGVAGVSHRAAQATKVETKDSKAATANERRAQVSCAALAPLVQPSSGYLGPESGPTPNRSVRGESPVPTARPSVPTAKTTAPGPPFGAVFGALAEPVEVPPLQRSPRAPRALPRATATASPLPIPS